MKKFKWFPEYGRANLLSCQYFQSTVYGEQRCQRAATGYFKLSIEKSLSKSILPSVMGKSFSIEFFQEKFSLLAFKGFICCVFFGFASVSSLLLSGFFIVLFPIQSWT